MHSRVFIHPGVYAMDALLRGVEEEEYVCVRLEVTDKAHMAMPAPATAPQE